MKGWEIVVGIETHTQLLTRSKIFSGASTDFGAPPNTQASAVDLALPGTLPVLNRAAVECAIRFGLAVNATINRRSIFARKNYFYPDLPKGYQISQYETPIVQGGELRIGEKVVRLTRAHLEEDAGKSLHEAFRGTSGIDLNRAGTPLLEIVSEPELDGAQEAVAYARALHALVMWIGICDGNMQEGSFRCDANVSVRRQGEKLGTRCEIKNLNSFRFMEQAIEFEARRQIEILESGGKVDQETRLYDPDRNETRSMRSKEDAQDYRYFPDPDLLPVAVSDEEIERMRATVRDIPETRMNRLVTDYALSWEQARLLTASKRSADYLEETLAHLAHLLDGMPLKQFQIPHDEASQVAAGVAKEVRELRAKLVANWMLGEIAGSLNRAGLEISDSPVKPAGLASLLVHELDKSLSRRMAKDVFEAMWAGEGDPASIIDKRGLKQISDAGAIEKLVDEVLAKNAKQVEDYRAGKEKAFNSLVGQVMKATQGKANPAQVNEILRKKLSR